MLFPKISAIIPCYNYARYVEQGIASVRAQRNPALDLVVFNDGSTDDSLALIRSHARGTTIVDQSNKGQVAACNASFAASTGDVVLAITQTRLASPLNWLCFERENGTDSGNTISSASELVADSSA